jgi:hypothetical protein
LNAFRDNIELWVREAVTEAGGDASVLETAKYIWARHEGEIRSSGDHFYSWQYDMRWAAQRLRDRNILTVEKVAGRSRWLLK